MKSASIVIVGAGPAGMAAAIAAQRAGGSALVIDDNYAAGGQIWRGGGPPDLFRTFQNCGAEFVSGARVVDGDAEDRWLRVQTNEVFSIRYSKLILATGARELFVPFPGWTLPNVFGVGGLQALAKSGLPVRGKRVVMAGTGPLLPAVAAYLEEHGARVPVIAEQASWASLRRFGTALLRHPGKIRQALGIKRSLLGTRYLPNAWVTGATGQGCVEEVSLLHDGREMRERCDFLAVGYGFVPNTELAQLLGCRMDGALVAVNDQQQTSEPDIYCAGEPTGLGGVDESLLEGRVAGAAAAGQILVVSRKSTRHFTRSLAQGFAVRPELKDYVTAETMVCRCEDVAFGRLQEAKSWKEAKLHFRCGMGPCQGRVCGPATEFLFGWKAESIRPPVFPVSIQSLVTAEETMHS